MIIQPYSYNGTLINSTDYETSIPRQSALAQLEANLTYVRRSGAEPVFAGKDFQPFTLNLEVKLLHNTMTLLESLNALFDVHDETPRQFIIRDTQDTSTDADGKQYYAYATPRRVLGGHDGQMAVVTLGFDGSVWQSVKQYSQTWNITASGDSTSITNNGNIEMYPTYEIAVTGYPSSGFIYNNFIEYLPPTTDAWNNRPLELCGDTDGIGLDTAALVAANKAQSDGDDFRVFVDGVEVDRWFGGAGFNTTDTKVWININQPSKRILKLKTAIPSTDTPTTVDFIYSSAFSTEFNAMPAIGRFKINSEEFTYTSKTITTTVLRANGVTRAVRNTSAGTHASSDTVTWIPYDINLVYGSSDAEAPEIDDTKKPILDLTNSKNDSFVYTQYSDEARLRSGIWNGQVTKKTNAILSITDLYTQVNSGDTDPADVAGMFIGAYQYLGTWKPETSILQWLIYVPDVVASVSHSWERYQQTASFPATVALQSSVNGTSWSNLKTFPSSDMATTDLQTWVTGSHATSDFTVLANTKYLRYYMSGTIPAVANNIAYMGFTTTTIGLTNAPFPTRRGEQNNYQFNSTITNGANNQAITINYPLRVGDTLYVDCNPDFPTAKINGQIVNGAIGLNENRPEWMAFNVGANTITFTSDYVGTVTITVKWYDRKNFQ